MLLYKSSLSWKRNEQVSSLDRALQHPLVSQYKKNILISIVSRLRNYFFIKGAVGSRSARLSAGQVMLMTILIISGTILGATTIAGLLMLYQIRQATDVVNSTKAIFAADNGLEWRLYKFYQDGQSCMDCPSGGVCPQQDLTNGSSFETECVSNASTVTIRSVGVSSNASRAFEIILEN